MKDQSSEVSWPEMGPMIPLSGGPCVWVPELSLCRCHTGREEAEEKAGNVSRGHMAHKEAYKAWSGRWAGQEINHLGLMTRRAQGRNRMGNKGGETAEPEMRAQVQSGKRQEFTDSMRLSAGWHTSNSTALWELSVTMI